MKIIGIGLNKTGTSTLKTCMRYWGFNHATYDLDAFNSYRAGDWERLNVLMDEYDSFENWPWALMYEAFDKRYPDAKFILTVRRDARTWFKSLCNHYKRMGPLTDFEQYIYGHANPCKHRKSHLDYYDRYNQKVIEYFQGRSDKLLMMCLEEGDGWPELCGFLDRPVPEIPFPHSNKTPNLWEKFERTVRPGLGRVRRKLIGTGTKND